MNVLSPNERTISPMWRLLIAPHRIHVNSEIVRSMNVLSQRYARDSTFILSDHRICAIDSTFINRIGIGTSERAISRSKQSCDKCPTPSDRLGCTSPRRENHQEIHRTGTHVHHGNAAGFPLCGSAAELSEDAETSHYLKQRRCTMSQRHPFARCRRRRFGRDSQPS